MRHIPQSIQVNTGQSLVLCMVFYYSSQFIQLAQSFLHVFVLKNTRSGYIRRRKMNILVQFLVSKFGDENSHFRTFFVQYLQDYTRQNCQTISV